jgi:hypothetical protein
MKFGDALTGLTIHEKCLKMAVAAAFVPPHALCDKQTHPAREQNECGVIGQTKCQAHATAPGGRSPFEHPAACKRHACFTNVCAVLFVKASGRGQEHKRGGG